MTVEILFMNGRGRMPSTMCDELTAGLRDAEALIMPHAALTGISVAVVATEMNVSARCFGPEAIVVYVNPDDPAQADWRRPQFCHLLCHELHHAVRWQYLNLTTFADWTPGEVLVLEGLATRAEMFLGLPSYPLLEVATAQVDPLLARLVPDVAKPYALVDWIDGACGLGPGIRAAGAMGHRLVGDYLAASGETPFSAIAVPWQRVWEIAWPRVCAGAVTSGAGLPTA